MGRRAVAAVVSLWVVSISVVVDRIVPDPYMDEIFHIPQAQRYCGGDLRSWDPMITTPPGLYCLSLAYIGALFPGISFMKPSGTFSEVCSTSFLRATNGVLAVICSIIIYDILIHLRPNVGDRRVTIYAICVALYPVHWFFSFLYYTDVASTTAVLAMFLASLKGHHWISSLLGAIAVFIRQTNVIWILFIAFNAAIDHVEAISQKYNLQSGDSASLLMEDEVVLNESRFETKSKLRRRFQHSTKSVRPSISEKSSLVHELYAIILKMWRFKWRLLISFFPFILVLAGFMTFVFWNGSIVLGAKEDHVASPHFAQMMYFGLISAAATAPLHFNSTQFTYLLEPFWKKRTTGILQWLVALVVGFVSVHWFSIAHPYLLADNRHYTFYFWRKIIRAHWASKYLMIPLCIYCLFSIGSILGKSRGRTWALSFFLACSAALVPAPLVEFRYYTVPIILFLLNSQVDSQISWALTSALFVATDVFTMSMFLLRPFQWAHQPGIQRFIW
ncbi:unnamed protein product [Spirodela intermedia]|uniref:Dol-P-Glc:Glc(2)Man(9)GlcNAc(2)-PP-Dol alpha-1,2-glucosyltransferase n=1 Tax=Spirodela intermedia TaxID=51605 RepID=A0A7I8LAP2_SPIIN|nr:unnamed protein product [Spirodela intermedia]